MPAAARWAPVGRMVLCLAVSIVMVSAGCGGGGGGGATGRLQVALTDQAGTYANVVVTIREVRVVPTGRDSNGGTLPVIAALEPPQQVDLLTLAYQQELLGEATVPAGAYEQVRLVLAPNPASGEPLNYVTLPTDPATKLPLTTPSGQESGLKVLGRFEVAAGQLNAIVLDFDPAKAIVHAGQSGRYLLKPTGIRIVQVSEVLPTYGSLSGTVQPPEAWPTALVQVLPQSSTAAIASGLVNPDDGTFRAFVPAGNYSLRVTASGFQPYDSALLSPPVFYTVATGADTPAGTITLTP